jgi:uncharacterized protein
VEHAESIIKIPQLNFTMTTNGLLLTPEICAFLAEHKFRVLVSIDGPEEIHDLYRVDIGGKGTYQRAFAGLKNLVEAYGEMATKEIHFSMVYAPPFSAKKIEAIEAYLENLPWFPDGISFSITYPSFGTIPIERFPNGIPNEDKSMDVWAFEKYKTNYPEKDKCSPFVKTIVEKPLTMLMQRQVLVEPDEKYYLNGCCMPGVRRLYISAQGKFHICERVHSDAPTFGDVDKGADIDTLKRVYVEGYDQLSRPVCSQCWAARLCTACYVDVFEDGQLDLETKKRSCLGILSNKEKWLKNYCTLMEIDPTGLDYLSAEVLK